MIEKKKVKMLVPSDMMASQSKMLYQLNKYFGERVQARKSQIAKTLREVCKVVQDVLKEVEVQEPRFISSLAECNGRFEGLEVISPNEFEVVLYLNQMGVFNFVDDGTLPGCAVLKLSDGRKRSMSLWVEFITASGYLSARKIRSRFQTLVAQVYNTLLLLLLLSFLIKQAHLIHQRGLMHQSRQLKFWEVDKNANSMQRVFV